MAAGVVKYDSAKHHRHSIRLKGYDYAAQGAYFVTICVQERECLFGEVAGAEVYLNDAGRMVEVAWKASPARFPNVVLDAHVVIPNHFHGIVILVGASLVDAPVDDAAVIRAGTSPAPTGGSTASMGAGTTGAGTSPAPTVGAVPTLGDVIGAFKSITTDEYIKGVRDLGWPPFAHRLWQRNYWEHIVRDERELNAVRTYIYNNPAGWSSDRDNPQNVRGLRPPRQIADYLADF